MTMGEIIKQARKKAGFTQQELANEIGKGFSTVQKYEMDLITPPPDTIIKISQVLKISVGQLMGQKTNTPEFLVSSIFGKSGYRLEIVEDIEGEYSNFFICDIESGKRYETTEADIQKIQQQIISYTRFEIKEYLKRYYNSQD